LSQLSPQPDAAVGMQTRGERCDWERKRRDSVEKKKRGSGSRWFLQAQRIERGSSFGGGAGRTFHLGRGGEVGGQTEG
jgi:hypothetical protein